MDALNGIAVFIWFKVKQIAEKNEDVFVPFQHCLIESIV